MKCILIARLLKEIKIEEKHKDLYGLLLKLLEISDDEIQKLIYK